MNFPNETTNYNNKNNSYNESSEVCIACRSKTKSCYYTHFFSFISLIVIIAVVFTPLILIGILILIIKHSEKKNINSKESIFKWNFQKKINYLKYIFFYYSITVFIVFLIVYKYQFQCN